ncbi:MAG: four helix bundle protein [Candidatus Magasanikbacteria bacterium]
MNDLDIPIFQQAYNLFKLFHSYKTVVPKQDRFTIFERCEQLNLDIIEYILQASTEQRPAKAPILERTSGKLNLLRVLVRLMKDVKTIDAKKYAALTEAIDEVGRQLGGWIRSVKA